MKPETLGELYDLNQTLTLMRGLFPEAKTVQQVQFLVLVAKGVGERYPQAQIAKEIGCDRSHIRHLLDIFVGIVKAYRNTQNRRIQHIRLTQIGQEKFDRLTSLQRRLAA